MGVIHRRAEFGPGAGWDGVEPQAYDDPSLAGVRKHELIGEAEGARDYRMRYFEVPVGGRTARERHAHDHGVMIVAGRARVTLGERTHVVGVGDVVYVAGNELHCFETLGEESLGFVCVIGSHAPPVASGSPRSSSSAASGSPRSSSSAASSPS
jgi:quercetin dioxygenase-like cupin family protein